MPDPTRIDPERLAALIDGRLGEAEASAVRAQLASADADTLAAYADAVALAGELRGAGASASADARPIASAHSARRRWLVPAMAAAAAGIVTVAILRSHDDGPASTNVAAGLPSGALEVPAWNSARSSDAPVTDRGRAVRVGVLLVQHELAAQRADTDASSRAAMIASLLDGVPGGAAGAMRWRRVASTRTPADERTRAADVEIARSLVDPDFAALGIWLESARVAAGGSQRAWFDANGTEALARAAAAPASTPAERDRISLVERLAKARPIDMPALAAAVAAAERELGR